jgi:glyoxylase-like metal-dependent hydrolase (beta-lactamase superfamily II)
LEQEEAKAMLRILFGLVVLAVAALAVFWISALGTIGKVTVSEMQPLPRSVPRDWGEVLAHAPVVKLTGFVTGWVEAGPEILIDANDPRTPPDLKRKLWVPSISYLLEHPTRGRALLDTGLRSGDCAYGTVPLYWVPCRNSIGSDAVSQLKVHGLSVGDISWIVMSHFHGDHASGLENLLRLGAPKIATTREEIDDVQSAWRPVLGYEAEMLGRDMNVVTINSRLQSMPAVGMAADFFGDGSLWLIPTPGHTRGEISMLVNTRPRVTLLTFDAAHLAADFDLSIAPGATVDRSAARASIARLHALANAVPNVQVIYGHEPAQWMNIQTRELGN